MSSPYRVHVGFTGVKHTRWWEWALRFVFGGVVTVGAGLAARGFGNEIGGLFLAFPSILPASLTLVAQHRGRDQAREDARGAAVGSFGLVVFGVVTWATATRWPPALVLAAATLGWLVTSVALWAALAARESENA